MADIDLFPSSFKPFALTTQSDPDVVIRGITTHDPSNPSSLPPLLLIHGFPQTYHIWHKIAPQLASKFTLVLPDIRGYGSSSKPASVAQYAKSAMARDMISVMDQLGFQDTPFYIAAHDRGARVAHKLLVDFPTRAKAAIFIDISPTLRMYEAADMTFATHYEHWFFLIQPAPFPETLMAAHPGLFIDKWIGGGVGARAAGKLDGRIDARCLDIYTRAVGDRDTAMGMCNDYRAARELDMEEQRRDGEAGRVIQTPLRVLWAKKGLIEARFSCVEDWQDVTNAKIKVAGRSVDSTHWMPEERPEEIIKEIQEFFL